MTEATDVVDSLTDDFDRALAISTAEPNQSAEVYQRIINRADLVGTEAVKLKEKSVYALAEIYLQQNRAEEVRALLVELRPFFESLPKSKAGKIVRTLIDKVMVTSTQIDLQIDLCQECITWAEEQNRTFLKQQIETRLGQCFLTAKRFQEALSLTQTLVRDIKKVDDKLLLVGVHLLESKIQSALRNVPKAKAALTAGRAAANSVYIGPLLQSEIDMQAGSLLMSEKDYKTAFSYFYEAFEGFDGLNRSEAPIALKYMLLSKIMNEQPQDVNALVSGKLALKYSSRQVDAMKAVAKAYQQRSLQEFQALVEQEYREEIQEDPVVSNKLDELRDKLLEQNLLRLLEPFERVEIDHIANLIQLDADYVQRKLSQMILDKKFNGILNQGAGAIVVYDDVEEDRTYEYAIGSVDELSGIVDKLFDKAAALDS